MKFAVRFGYVFVLAAMLPGFAGAQMGMHAGPAMRGIFNPVVGSGGQYEMTSEKGTKTVMEIAVVGKESVDGKEGYWFEMTMANTAMGQMTSKTLTVLDGQDTVVYKMKDGSGDAWVAPKAGPYGLVKFQGKDTSMVLTKVITDAKDQITGTPQPFNPMMFQQNQQHP
jgi:hypothetical protein